MERDFPAWQLSGSPQRKMNFVTVSSTPQGHICCWPPGGRGDWAGNTQAFDNSPLSRPPHESNKHSRDSRADPDVETRFYSEKHQRLCKEGGNRNSGLLLTTIRRKPTPRENPFPREAVLSHPELGHLSSPGQPRHRLSVAYAPGQRLGFDGAEPHMAKFTISK